MLLEAWRLGEDAPTAALLPFADDTTLTVRWRAVYSLARLRAPAAANHLIAALRADDPGTRAVAARALNRDFAVAAKLEPATVAGLLSRAVDDDDAGVRINALRSLATYRDSSQAPLVASRIDDQDANVRVQAAASLGELGSSVAGSRLARVLQGKGGFALRREALLGLARSDPAAFGSAVKEWQRSADWRERAAAAEGWARAGASGDPWFTQTGMVGSLLPASRPGPTR